MFLTAFTAFGIEASKTKEMSAKLSFVDVLRIADQTFDEHKYQESIDVLYTFEVSLI